MWKLGHNNWIHYGWGDDLKKNRNSDEHLVYYFENVSKDDSKNSIESAIYTVNTIVENYPSPYYLMCSGGVDSQAMLYSWYISKKSFHVVFVKYISNGIWFNEHDFFNLKLFTERYNIEVEFIDFDVIKFLETDMISYAKKSDCDSFQICTHMRMSDEIKSGTVIFSGNFINPNIGGLPYTQTALHRYAILTDTEIKKIIPFFFIHMAVTEVFEGNLLPALAAQAVAGARAVAQELDYVGVLCVEFFVLSDGRLVVNEIAPRPHNSGHYTQNACDVSQFELQVRTLAGLPLAQPRQHSPATMLNLLGELWGQRGADSVPDSVPDWAAVLALPGTHLHLYGKHEARPGRKMGHLNVTGATPEQVRATALCAAEILGIAAF